jgi:signal transduction histidine kinase/CheY-like chemotaxis protein
MRKLLIGICAILATGAAAWYLWMRTPDFGERVYRIGWMISPPFQVRGAGGEASGISVDLVNLAARRRGIRLEWVFWGSSSESALVSKSVDLWPLITITPERLKVLHISEPYLRHEHCLLVRDDAPYTAAKDLAAARIGVANPSIDVVNLRKVLPSAAPVADANIESVIDSVCRRTTEAAFMDRYTAITALLKETGCGGHNLRWLPVPQVQSELGVGSTFESKAAADAIRHEIGVLAQEGKLAAVFGQWGFMSGQDVAAVEAVINAKRREAFLAAVAVIFAVMFVLACWQTVRLVRERTRSRRTEEALRESQERFMQAQKLESIGRLAGGVAHDFNNLLTVINGYGDLLLRQLPEQDPRRWQVDEICKAGARAAELTGQLLAFGRKQVGRPRPLNLNSVIEESEKMLRRLLGEDVQTVIRLDPSLGLAMADPGHFHQVLMNLAVNARDAMPGGGTLVIETAGEPLHPWPAASKSEARTGPAVRLSVSDTGKGMDKATLKNIFEPFFTTKGTKGTGLGLATVYGIVQQHQGSIDVVSEPDKGTTFRIYLPQVDATPERDAGVTDGSVPVRGTGTVLVVEDQEEVRGFVVQALRERGYDVLSAGDGEQAISTAAQHSGNIDVLLTDVVLPGINGREVAERLKHARSSLKVIYTSGYTQDLIADRGVLHSDVSFVPKPYTAEQIAAKVRETLQPD